MSEALSRQLEQPIRYPETSSASFMTRRSLWLIVLGFLLPGSAQVLAGNRKLGRVGLGATFTLVVIGLLTLAGLAFVRVPTLSFFTNTIVLFIVQWVLLAYAVLWLVLGIDTLRLTNIIKVGKNWRIPVAFISVLLTIVPIAGAVWASTTVSTGRDALSSIFTKGTSVKPIDGRYNILLLGTDAGSDRSGMRADSISLISVDAETGQSIIVGLPRELISMPFPEDSPMHEYHPHGFGVAPNVFGEWGGCHTRCFLNAVSAEITEADAGINLYGNMYPGAEASGSTPGIEATKDAVTGATGLEVQFFVLINMDGFSSLIDALGGVEINVTERLPIGGDQYGNNVEGYIEPGLQRLDGFDAQWYARSRYGSANGDYDRMNRQRELQAAILAQLKPEVVLTRFQSIVEAGTYLVKTDLPDGMLGPFLDLATRAKNHSPIAVELTPPTVDAEYPDYDVVHQLVRDAVVQASPPDPETEEAE